mmetsp:Transcript_22175/g.40798  ORF Transcript_22175/g.40798 Transcript_22175/m.40798 type:complete len:181 (+) Transcript_22175:145-687(+)
MLSIQEDSHADLALRRTYLDPVEAPRVPEARVPPPSPRIPHRKPGSLRRPLPLDHPERHAPLAVIPVQLVNPHDEAASYRQDESDGDSCSSYSDEDSDGSDSEAWSEAYWSDSPRHGGPGFPIVLGSSESEFGASHKPAAYGKRYGKSLGAAARLLPCSLWRDDKEAAGMRALLFCCMLR